MEKIELLSPAGDLEKLHIAYLFGADACYIGGKDYSLRANANNFSIDDIKEATLYAHNLKKRIYVTVNIIFHNEDLKGITEYLKKLNEIKVDGVILSDLFLIGIIKKEKLSFKIIMSTQISSTNSYSVKYLHKLGADQVVLARELNKTEIKHIYDETKVPLEVFLHGAMCTCLSGRCVLSNYFTNRDSNRGGCAQVCRFNFLLDKKRRKEFSIASKDLNLAKYIPELIDIGVKTLKIEGRMRSNYYIATVNSCYRNLIDAYYNNNFTKELLDRNIKILNRVANRESSSQFFNSLANYNDQYYLGREEVSNQDFLAQVISYDSKTKLALVEQRNYFKIGDKVNIFGPDGLDKDFIITKIIDSDDKEKNIANHPKELLEIPIPFEVLKDSMIRVRF